MNIKYLSKKIKKKVDLNLLFINLFFGISYTNLLKKTDPSKFFDFQSIQKSKKFLNN